MIDKLAGFTIRTVSQRTGLSVYTLRAWERRYGVPAPRRNDRNRYRLYGEDDIADLNWMKQQVESGISPAQAAQMLREPRPAAGRIETDLQPLAETASALQAALLRSDEYAARRVLDEAFALFAIEQATLQIIQPTLVEIGERWMKGELTVWQEHFATNLIRQKLLAVLQSQFVPPESVPYLVCACAPGEQHEMGLAIFALVARRRGWRVVYLGQGTPLASISELVASSQPHVVAMSVTTVVGLATLIPWLDARNRPDTRLAFGGHLLNLIPSLREHLPGAYLGEDALAATSVLGDVETSERPWSPSHRALSAAYALQTDRLKIAGETVTRLLAEMPPNLRSKWNAQGSRLDFATLFLLDLLACALAFGAPALIEFHRSWLRQALFPKDVPGRWISVHLDVLSKVLTKELESDYARLIKPLFMELATEPDPSTRQ